jgi:hypothetical protein
MGIFKTNGGSGKAGEEGGEGEESPYHHLLVCIHGLFGKDKDLEEPRKVIRNHLKKSCKDEEILVYIPKSNNGLKTLAGIEACGARLVAELQDLVAKHPRLETISLMGHSLGGLLARYCIAHGYALKGEKGKEATVFGLKPLHLITVATPNLGQNDEYMRDIRNEDSVTPCLQWMASIPFIGKVGAFLFHHCEAFVVAMLLRQTGKDLFLRDSEDPIIVRMAALDTEDEGEDKKQSSKKYLDALSSFKERTCYGNVQYDHLVAWENATIRRKAALPKIDNLKGLPYGIVNEEVSFSLAAAAASTEEKGKKDNHPNTGIDHQVTASPTTPLRATGSRQELMIGNLEKLGWRRIDVKMEVSLKGCAILPHDHILSRHRWKDDSSSFRAVASRTLKLCYSIAVDLIPTHHPIPPLICFALLAPPLFSFADLSELYADSIAKYGTP